MGEFVSEVAKWLLSQGWPGVVILLLVAAVVIQWREIIGVRKLIFDLQSCRVEDAQKLAKESVEVISSCKASILTLVDVVKVGFGQRSQ